MGANYPIWSRDGAKMIYWDGEGGGGIYTKPVSGLGGPELLKKEALPVAPSSISADSKLLVYVTAPGSARQRLWIHELAPEKSDTKDYPLLGTNFLESNAQFSPDGSWLAYSSDDTGRLEIYVVPFPSLSSKTPISTSGGRFPRWRRDGREMFYVAPDGNMMAVALDASGNSPNPSTPKPLFPTRLVTIGSSDYQYDVTADGQRFLINSPPAEQDSEPITLYVNWMAALQK
jgi:Tol biopolymer transport system component